MQSVMQEPLFYFFAESDITLRADQAGNGAVGAANGEAAAAHPNVFAVLVPDAVLALVLRSSSGHVRGDAGLQMRDVLWVNPIEPFVRTVGNLIFGVAEQRLPALR